jgi:hypothetical protein
MGKVFVHVGVLNHRDGSVSRDREQARGHGAEVDCRFIR